MTGVGMMDCKKALAETDGDMDKAVEFLREKGLAAAQPRRPAASLPRAWLTPTCSSDGAGAVVGGQRRDRLRGTERPVRRVRQGCVLLWWPSGVPPTWRPSWPCPYRRHRPDRAADAARRRSWSSARTSRSAASPALTSGMTVPYIHMHGGKIGVLVNLDVSEGLATDARSPSWARTWPCRSPL